MKLIARLIEAALDELCEPEDGSETLQAECEIELGVVPVVTLLGMHVFMMPDNAGGWKAYHSMSVEE